VQPGTIPPIMGPPPTYYGDDRKLMPWVILAGISDVLPHAHQSVNLRPFSATPLAGHSPDIVLDFCSAFWTTQLCANDATPSLAVKGALPPSFPLHAAVFKLPHFGVSHCTRACDRQGRSVGAVLGRRQQQRDASNQETTV
jgi:hypothetical protein